MHGAPWLDLISSIPKNLHDNLMVMTSSGAELNLSNIFRVERDYMLIRGRLAGTTDAAKVIFVPFDQITYMGFRTEMNEQQVVGIFGESNVVEGRGIQPVFAPTAAPQPVVHDQQPPVAPTPAPTPMPAAPVAPAPTPAAPAMPVATPAAASGAPLPGKAALLERLRKSRMSQG